MADRRNEPTLDGTGGQRRGAGVPPLAAEPPPAEPPPWRGEERSGRLWWLLLVLLILAGLGWYLWDKGHLARLEASLFGAAEPAPALPGGLAASEAAELEALLAAMALEPGPADGTLDQQTAEAIRAFQEMAGLPIDGKASPALLEELRAVARQLGIEVGPGS